MRRLLTEKINSNDERATYNINFEKGVIENLTAGTINTDTLVQGHNNNLAVNSPKARVGTSDTKIKVENSAGVQIGTGHTSSGDVRQSNRIDYSAALPTLESWQQFYAKQDGSEALAAKLDEMITLMRGGTPEKQSRNKLHDLVQDATAIFSAYPHMVEMLRQIGRLAGF